MRSKPVKGGSEDRLSGLTASLGRQVWRWKSWWRYEPEVFFGFDLVSDQLRWVRLAKKPRASVRLGWKWELADFGIHDLAPTPDFDEADKERALIEYLQELVPPGRYPRARFYLSIQGPGVLFRRFTIPALKKKSEEKQAVLWEARKQTPFPIENAYWTYRTVQKEGESYKKTEVIFVAIVRSLLDRQVALFLQAGVPLSGVTLGGFGFADVLPVIPHEETDAVGVLEISPKSSYFTLYGKNGMEFFREFSSIGLKPSDLEAGALVQFLEPLTAEVLSSLDFYQAQVSGRKVARLYLTGLPAGDVTITAHFENILGIKVSILSQSRELFYAVDNAAEFAELYPFFAKALGTALGRDKSPYLLPEAVEKSFRLQHQNRLVFRFSLPVLAVAVLFQGFQLYRLHAAEALVGGLEKELARLQAVPGFSQAAFLEQKILSTQNFLSQFVRHPAVFPWHMKELSNLTPPEIELARVTLLPLMLDSLSARQKHGVFEKLEISGTAAAPYERTDAVVVEFIRRLEHSPFFGRVKVVSKSEEKFGSQKTVGFALEVALR
ncbi:MAG: hypothetical protein L0196_02105 [candidate division Zixibacteria bacterium]|nr:hypothetical protein [candidate division Zixibacteria bacterium]